MALAVAAAVCIDVVPVAAGWLDAENAMSDMVAATTIVVLGMACPLSRRSRPHWRLLGRRRRERLT
jgi:hypothetical protein